MTEYPYLVHLDRMFRVEGTYADGVTTWTLPMANAMVDRIVLSNAFGELAGDEMEPDSVAADKVTLAGDWSAGEVIIGRSYAASIELSQPFRRDENGVSDITGRLQIRRLAVAHTSSGAYSVRTIMEGRAERATAFAPAGRIDPHGHLIVRHNGNTVDLRNILTSDAATGVTWTALDYTADYDPRE